MSPGILGSYQVRARLRREPCAKTTQSLGILLNCPSRSCTSSALQHMRRSKGTGAPDAGVQRTPLERGELIQPTTPWSRGLGRVASVRFCASDGRWRRGDCWGAASVQGGSVCRHFCLRENRAASRVGDSAADQDLPRLPLRSRLRIVGVVQPRGITSFPKTAAAAPLVSDCVVRLLAVAPGRVLGFGEYKLRGH